MIIRIVKMTFQPERVDDFLENFEKNKKHIRTFEGCNRLELLKEEGRDDVYFTYSYWDNLEALENYRHSQLFKGVWSFTKALFADKPQAWSLQSIDKQQ